VEKVLFLEAHKDQAKTLSSFLRKDKRYELYYSDELTCNEQCKEDYDIIVPSGADSTFNVVSKLGDIRIGQVVYTKDNLITFDKIKTLDLVKSVGVPIPASYLSKDEINFFPVFYKSLREEGYSKRGIVRNELDLEEVAADDIFYQEFIWSKGTYSVGFLADRGKLITTFSQKEIISYPYHGGSGVILTQIDDHRLIDYTERIVKAVNYSGWGLTEFKYCNKREDYVFMEVNAKFWASLRFAFINNPMFMKLLFDIDMKPKNINTVVYIDRVILSDWQEIWVSLPYLFKAKWLKSQSVSKVLWKRIKNDRIGRHSVKIMS